MPMGMADVATVLFKNFLRFNPKNPDWLNRDRFVLSAGHGSMLLYSLLYLTGYKSISINNIKKFRQLNSICAGHPEYHPKTGRANSSMLDMIKVDVYGQLMPINQLASINVPEARLITIQVWDQSNVKAVDSAIQKSDLGVNPQIDGTTLRIRIPDLTEERRKDLIKVLKNIGEKNKVSVRNIRREANDELKRLVKDKKISEDENKLFEKNIQKITDDHISNIDKILIEKEKEILQV